MKKEAIVPMPEYYDRYINLMENIELSTALAQSLERFDTINIAQLEAIGNRAYLPEKWTIKEIFQHLIDVERIYQYRILRFARNDKTAAPGFEADDLSAQSKAGNRSLAGLVEELKVVRIATIYLFDSFDEELLLRRGVNWKYDMSVLAMGFILLGHERSHFNAIEKYYLPLLN